VAKKTCKERKGKERKGTRKAGGQGTWGYHVRDEQEQAGREKEGKGKATSCTSKYRHLPNKLDREVYKGGAKESMQRRRYSGYHIRGEQNQTGNY
jgi:hypothetical protein